MTVKRDRRRWTHRVLVGLTLSAVIATITTGAANAAPPVRRDTALPPSINTEFVTRQDSRLMLDGEQFRFAGTNIYWLGLDENVGGVDYPTYFRIRDALDTVKAMGMTVVRSHMLASTGNELSILPSKEEGFNEEAFRTVDYAIAYAGSIGVRLILPLTDEWAYYHGGHRDFTDPYGLPSSAFYTDPRVIADYQAYVQTVMQRVNPLTGLRYVDDPTIMAWEFGNELEGMTPEWLEANAAKFAEWAPDQLIAAGRRFDIDADTLAVEGIDIVDVHYYPPTVARVTNDAATITAAGKVYIAGEYASTAATDELLVPLAADPNVTGMLSWSLFGHNDRGGFVQHDDGFTFHYPGDNERMIEGVQAQINFAIAVGGEPADSVTGVAPLVTEVDKRGGLNVLTWRGTAGAVGYVVERSKNGKDGWTAAREGLLTDNDTPWIDPTAPGNVWYRVVPIDAQGDRGPSSDAVYVGAGDIVLADPLETLDIANGHAGVVIQPSANGAVVRPAGSGPAWVSWNVENTRQAQFVLVTGHASNKPDVTVQVSDDGATWRDVRASVKPEPIGGGKGFRFTLTVDTASADYVRIAWTGSGASRAGLSRATFWSADPAPVTTPPGTVALQAPAAGATNMIDPQTFSWTAASGAGYYTLTVSPNADLSNPVITETAIEGTSFSTNGVLEPGTTYYWQVAAVNARGTTASETRSFTTRALPTESAVIDDFESYATSADLAAEYPRNNGGGLITPTLIPGLDGGQAMQLDAAPGSAGYAGVINTLSPPLDIWGHEGIELYVDRSGIDANITVQFVAGGIYWEYTLAPDENGTVRIPFSSFDHPGWAWLGDLNLTQFSQLSFYVGGNNSGQLIIDNVVAYPAG